MKKTILVLGAGSGGSNNLIRSLRQCDLVGKIVGTNCVKNSVVKSSADISYYFPESNEPEYLNELIKVIKTENIDLIIPNNDREVAAISEIRDQLPATTFLPDKDDVETCQDKNRFYTALKENGEPVPEFVQIKSKSSIADDISTLEPFDKLWVRPIKGSGSTGATWVQNAEQASHWMQLWNELRGFEYEDFQVSHFLKGRDFNFQSIWKSGELVTYGLIERLSYFMGRNRLSGMSSSPEVAISRYDKEIINKVTNIIRSICKIPNGSINVDIKEGADGEIFVTEFNIGRFPMITTIHDACSSFSPASAYIYSAFDIECAEKIPTQITVDVMMIRDLDTEPCIISKDEIPKSIGQSV